MKTKTFFLLLIGVVIALSTSCDKEIIATGISLDQDTLVLELETSDTLIAALEPADAIGVVVWSSSDPLTVTVNAGVVTAHKKGTATIVASQGILSASCDVTVVDKITVPTEVLTGSDYYVIQMDETSFTTIEDKVIQDLRPDNQAGSKNLFIWENTFLTGTSSGDNFFGEEADWVSLLVSSVGWSGAGYNIGASYAGNVDMTRMYDNPGDYYLHIGLKSGQSSSYLFILADGQTEAKVAIGGTFVDNSVAYPEYANFERDNEWHSIEIPVSHLNSLGLFFDKPFKDVNIFSFLAGGIAGTTLDMDAVFFYKKGE